MNHMNDLMKGNITISQLMTKHKESILKEMKHFIQMVEEEQSGSEEVVYSKERYEAFRQNNDILKYTDYTDMLALLKIEEKSHDNPNKSRIDAEYTEVTNPLLVRTLANDLYSEDVELYFNHYSQADIERRNDRVYQYLQKLGYNGQKDSHIPELIRGNYALFQKKEHDVDYTRAIIEIEERMKYLLHYLNANPNKQFTITKDSLLYIMKGRKIGDIVKELYGNTKTFEEIVQEKMGKKITLYEDADIRKSRQREPDVYNNCQKMCDELASNPSKEVNMDTYQKLAETWFNHQKHEAIPSVKSGFEYYKEITGLQYVRANLFHEVQSLSEKLLTANRIKSYFKNTFSQEDGYDALLKKMILFDDTKKENEKPVPEFALLDSTEKVLKALWHFSEKVTDITFNGVDKAVSMTKKGIEKYKLKRPTPNAVVYVGPYVLVERIEPNHDENSQKQIKKVVAPSKKEHKEEDDFGDK